MATMGWILRSGGADGADTYFETGCTEGEGETEIYLPWKGYNNSTSTLYPPSQDARKIAQEIYPVWKTATEPVRLMMARNVHQVLGQSLNAPVKFLVCYTPDGCTSIDQYSRKTGGTGMAISVASLFDVPIFNLHDRSVVPTLVDFLEQFSDNIL